MKDDEIKLQERRNIAEGVATMIDDFISAYHEEIDLTYYDEIDHFYKWWLKKSRYKIVAFLSNLALKLYDMGYRKIKEKAK